MARMLASVTDEREARLVATLGADIVDAKDPGAGALGALPLARVKAIRAAVPAEVPVSATVGDPTDDVEAVAAAAVSMADTGIEIVKVGLSLDCAAERTLARLGTLDLGGAQLVGVLLADRGIDLDLIAHARDAGLSGLMLDTADKRRGALPDIVSADELSRFIAAVRAAGLFAGLAGSLRVRHVPQLLALQPDVIGFRGGLCREGERTGELDADAIEAVRRAIPMCDAAIGDACPVAAPGAMAPHQTEDVA
ncbi:MAG TPA: (5-formylfuran-3-yl)methyl phosphate synthase [Hyphomicrobium sp.]|nr:(5-formylfuran-3-yl)methyl phosphate synthase [Hyphomicrobium sp.]